MIGGDIMYGYLSSDVPRRKINYSYSKFYGQVFLDAWRDIREEFISNSLVPDLKDITREPTTLNWSENYVTTETFMDHWLYSLVYSPEYLDPKLLLLIKRFEVTRKIYTTYKMDMRPINRTEYDQAILYAKFGVVLSQVFLNTRRFPALNALIKVNDILLSNGELDKSEADAYMLLSISSELKIINQLVQTKLKTWL